MMAAPTIAEVMAGIETRLNTISGLRVTDYAADQINPPAAMVTVPPITSYHATMKSGRMMLEPSVLVFVSGALDRVGQLLLAEYANPTGAKSIKAAIEADPTLGGKVDDCKVMSFRPMSMQEVGMIHYYGGVFELKAVADGS